MTDAYIAAVRDLASTGAEADILFSRLSDEDAGAVAGKATDDATFRAAVLHPHCLGLVDTFVLMVARIADDHAAKAGLLVAA